MSFATGKQVSDKLRTIITQGASIAGAGVAGTVGFLAAGPAGAAAAGLTGGAISNALVAIGNEIADRVLGPREAARAGAILVLAQEEISRRLSQGEAIRDDDFFDNGVRGRSKAEEISEAIIAKAQRDPEEQKLRYMANLLAYVAFNQAVSVDFAHQMTRAADRLSYRQLRLLAVFVRDSHGLRTTDYRNMPATDEVVELLYEIYDMYQAGLIAMPEDAMLGVADAVPAKFRLQPLGSHLYVSLGLSAIPSSELQALKSALAK